VIQIGWKDQRSFRALDHVDLDTALDLVKDVFTSAGERDIHTGDSVDIYIVTTTGIRCENFALKKD
jgi:20S proteasome subunit beta 6